MQLIKFLLCSLLFMISTTMNAQAKNIYGLHEHVRIQDLNNLEIKAKLDTGALTSSFSATKLKFFEKDGREWVRFKPQIKGHNLPSIEKEVIRYSNIKMRQSELSDNNDKFHTQRPVVLLDICFDGVVHTIEVNLADRSRFNYPLLIGSSTLIEFNAIVDPSLKFLSNSKCKL